MELNGNIQTIGLVIILSVTITLWYSILKQEWLVTHHQKYVSVLLAPAVHVITLAISNNMALALGMIGALSIVRFRNPVKSPAELSIYFIYIVIGVSSGVDVKYALLIWGVAMVAPFLVMGIDFILKALGRNAVDIHQGFVGHFQIQVPLEDVLASAGLNGDHILSIHETESEDSKITNLSIKILNQADFLTTSGRLTKCGPITSSSLQQSF